MSEIIFDNQIASFFPVNSNSEKTFYFKYNNLPMSTQITFDLAITAFNPNIPYQLHLTINKDNFNQGSRIINMYLQTNPATIKTDQKDDLADGLNSANFSLTTPPINISNGTHTYLAKIELLDMQGRKLDSGKTWFTTGQKIPTPPTQLKEGLNQ